MKTDPRIIADLKTSCSALATIVEQYRIDALALKCVECDWLASKYSKWYDGAEAHLEILIKDQITGEADGTFVVGKLVGGGEVIELLNRNLAFAQSTFDQFTGFRTKAMQIRNDDIPDDYEHAIQFLKKVIVKTEAQIRLIGGLSQPGYIGARLEDG